MKEEKEMSQVSDPLIPVTLLLAATGWSVFGNYTQLYLPLLIRVEKGKDWWFSPLFTIFMVDMRLSNPPFAVASARIQVT